MNRARIFLVVAALAYLLCMFMTLSAEAGEGRRGHRPTPEDPGIIGEPAEEEVEEVSPFEAYAYPPERRERRRAEQAPSSSFAEAYCGGGHIGVQTPTAGVALTGSRDRACAHALMAESLRALAGEIAALEDPDATPVVVDLYKQSFDELALAREELRLDETVVRRAFVMVFGSLPLLNYLAPR